MRKHGLKIFSFYPDYLTNKINTIKYDEWANEIQDKYKNVSFDKTKERDCISQYNKDYHGIMICVYYSYEV